MERLKITKFIHQGVKKDGTMKGGGAVITDGGIRVTRGNCGSDNCHCSDGYFITVIMPRRSLTENGTYGIVEGIKIQFDSLKELEDTLS